ncbi:MAG: hypothetical protein LBH85_06145 [Treponema sp.]|nr:hypothetical protein [Treponema sp.]
MIIIYRYAFESSSLKNSDALYYVDFVQKPIDFERGFAVLEKSRTKVMRDRTFLARASKTALKNVALFDAAWQTNGGVAEQWQVKCPRCASGAARKNGTFKNGKQRFLCCNESHAHNPFVAKHAYNTYDPNVRSRIFFSIVNGSGTRATARTLGMAKRAFACALRSVKAPLWHVNYDCVNSRQNGVIKVELVLANKEKMND